ncbi:delta-1-pyrroline-5-carboxylate dehydrogenase, mitochondrial-like isoform X1 [Acanthaster planci]|uniref:Multifunctional fusion protein n=1 Tax=Acanthaster planci TaxID=133434 RepID=A0A8B7YB30_ACAPL|nr:delta-1-pyrroline-5-carboxylate dehydrogenase, mitochondrial-like isoform X1 [Acanthaster planci]
MLRTRLFLQRAYQGVRCLSFKAQNEPIKQYAKDSPERKLTEEALNRLGSTVLEIPCVIGGEEIFTDDVQTEVSPFDHSHKLASVHYGNKELINKAIQAALSARTDWEARPLEDRVQIFLKAADLISTKYRADLVAAVMLGQAKTTLQAELDIVCELADFYRFHGQYALDLINVQPLSTEESSNSMLYRGLEGFVAAVSPFNFTAIGGNLAGTPAMMGNTVVWKPSPACCFSSYKVYEILREAGVPDGVINFIPAPATVFGDTITASPDLAAVAFVGSTKTFQHLWKQVGQNLDIYKTFPRLIGECGGKNYHLIHPSADIDTVVNCTVRSAFEFGGQKCSACSRMYVPESLWSKVKEGMLEIHKQIKIGPPSDFSSFYSAVIDAAAFDKIKSYLDYARTSPSVKTLAGGNCDKSKGYFVEPTIYETNDLNDKLMKEEIFGPVVTVYVYPDNTFSETAEMISKSSAYGLTGAIFARDSEVTETTANLLRDSAGNFYINDKSTGSVVGQQPFGGGRLSGTNDKAGGALYIQRWVSPQSVKQTHKPITEWRYPSMEV